MVITQAFQACDTGSIPAARSILYLWAIRFGFQEVKNGKREVCPF